MSRAYSDIAFTPRVRAVQSRRGSRSIYAPLDSTKDRCDALTAQQVEFISEHDGFYQATVSETGWPYVQYRGGSAGFLRVMDPKTVAYTDFRGNVQYIVRVQTAHMPILMLTARSGELDRVLGLELGADDYLTKPFSVLELQARVRALLRRSSLGVEPLAGTGTKGPSAIDSGPIRIDRGQRRVWLRGHEISMTPREFDLLWHFVNHPGRVFTRTELLGDVWGYGHDGYDHTVNSHINRLRSKLGDERAESSFIHTIWGVGYRFEVCA